MKICVVGDIVLDIIPAQFPIEKEKILMDGETFVDGTIFQRGGCGGNFVCVLKSFFPDIEVDFISRIGTKTDNWIILQNEMEKYGVNSRFVKDPTVSTQSTVAISYGDGERHFITDLGGLDNFTIEDIPNDAFNGINHLSYRGPWFSEKLLFQCSDLLKRAQNNNITTSLDLGFDPYWNKEDPNSSDELQIRIKKRKQSILDALVYVDFLFGNQMEILKLTGKANLDEGIKDILEKGVKYIILHRGSKGAAIITSDEFIEIKPNKIEIVNPVGSGDTFDSIFVGKISSYNGIKNLNLSDIVSAAKIAFAGAEYSLKSPVGTIITMEKVLEDMNQ